MLLLQNAGLQGGTKESAGPLGHSSLASWDEWHLHRLVAHFLAARFPILLALNKVGKPWQQRVSCFFCGAFAERHGC